MAKRRHNAAKERFWRQVIARRERSGLTVRAFCEDEGLSEPSFYTWRRELARRDRAAAQASAATFVPVQIVAEPNAAIEIVLPGGALVRVRPGFDRPTLRQVVQSLTGGPSC
jgi:transposase